MSKYLKNIAAGLGAIATAGAIAGLGYGVGRDSKSDLVELLERENGELKSSNERLSSENEGLRIKAFNESPSNVVELSAEVRSDEPLSESGRENEVESIQTVKVPRQQTATLFDGALEITTISIDYTGTPLVHRVTASVLLPGSEPVKLDRADPGEAIKIGDFQVVITETDTFYAVYRVYRLPKT